MGIRDSYDIHEPVNEELVARLIVHLDRKQQPEFAELQIICLLYTSPSPRDRTRSRMPSSAWKKKKTNHHKIQHHDTTEHDNI